MPGRLLTRRELGRLQRRRSWRRAAALCRRIGAEQGCDGVTLLGIYTLERHFRPLPMRLCEYALFLGESCLSVFRGGVVPNRTLGPCQIGLSAMLRAGGREVPLHTRQVRLRSAGECAAMLRAASPAHALGFLALGLRDAFREAQARYPNAPALQRRAVGRSFNGRYGYGLMLEKVCGFLTEESE